MLQAHEFSVESSLRPKEDPRRVVLERTRICKSVGLRCVCEGFCRTNPTHKELSDDRKSVDALTRPS